MTYRILQATAGDENSQLIGSIRRKYGANPIAHWRGGESIELNEQEAISKLEEIVRKEENTNQRVATSILDQNLRALFPAARCEDVDAMQMSKSKLRKVRCGESERESSRRRCRAISVRPVHTQQNTAPLLGTPNVPRRNIYASMEQAHFARAVHATCVVSFVPWQILCKD